jgi:hypothetical protein
MTLPILTAILAMNWLLVLGFYIQYMLSKPLKARA